MFFPSWAKTWLVRLLFIQRIYRDLIMLFFFLLDFSYSCPNKQALTTYSIHFVHAFTFITCTQCFRNPIFRLNQCKIVKGIKLLFFLLTVFYRKVILMKTEIQSTVIFSNWRQVHLFCLFSMQNTHAFILVFKFFIYLECITIVKIIITMKCKQCRCTTNSSYQAAMPCFIFEPLHLRQFIYYIFWNRPWNIIQWFNACTHEKWHSPNPNSYYNGKIWR